MAAHALMHRGGRLLAGCLLSVAMLAGCSGQQYTTVTVKPWNPVSPPWDSTLWGIAGHYHVPGGANALAQFNGVQSPSMIQPGQQIKIPL